MAALVQTPAESADLTTLADVKEEILGSTAPGADDALFGRLIGEASDLVMGLAARRFERAQFVETVWGGASDTLKLERRPLAEVSEILVDGVAIDLTDIEILNPEGGLIYSPTDWSSSTRYTVTYRAGFFLPGEAVSTAEVAVAGDPTNTFDIIGVVKWPIHLVARAATDTLVALGDFITNSGFSSSSNNGSHRVTAVNFSTQVVTVASELVTQATGGAVKTMSPVTLPGELSRATSILVRAAYLARDRDPALKMAELSDDRFDFDAKVVEEVSPLIVPWADPDSPLLASQPEESSWGGQVKRARA